MPLVFPKERFHVTRPYLGVYHVQFPKPAGALGDVDLAFHFLRFQEHYESPGFKGRVFTWAQYAAWYRRVRGRFTYPWDWAGFNIPGRILEPFRAGAFDPLTPREKALLAALREAGPGDYVIGTWAEDAGAVDHELAHACWALDPAYQERVRAILAGGDFSLQKAALAQDESYDEEMHLDEIQACAIDGSEDYAPDAPRRALILGAFEEALARRLPWPAGVPRSLALAYGAARYEVAAGKAGLALRVGEANAGLLGLFREFGEDRAVAISADNPRSRPSGPQTNAQARGRLLARLEAGGWRFYEGESSDPQGVWPKERFWLVLGMGGREGLALAQEFGQNAVLVAGSDAVPRLAYTGPLVEG